MFGYICHTDIVFGGFKVKICFMMYSNCCLGFLFIISLLFTSATVSASGFASDIEREKRLADEIVDAILDGEPINLEVTANGKNHEFLGIYTESDDARGTAIILHGRGFHPDWGDVVSPVRVGLTDSGWNTLSIQLPVLEKQAKYFDYVPLFPEALPRIDAAIAYARQKLKDSGRPDKVVLIAHSCGAHMAMAWVDAKLVGSETFDATLLEDIDAYIGIGMGATDYKQPMAKPFPLDSMTIPVLDVYGENDYPSVRKMAAERIDLIKRAGNSKSAQVVVPKSNHYFADKGEELTEVIAEWLNTL